MIGILVAALVAAVLTAAITPFVRQWVEKHNVVDQPEARRVNTTPKPRAGGVAIYLGFVIAVILTVTWRHFAGAQHAWSSQTVGVLLATTFVALTGLIDDFRDLRPKWQILAIVGAALILYASGVRIEGVTNPLGGTLGPKYNPLVNWHALPAALSVVATVIWVFVVTKTVDAIDGVDGLASGVCAIAATALALMAAQIHTPEGPTLALLAAAIAGACIGFLRHNYHPSKIIMGTVGAWVLGVPLAAISIMGAFKAAAAVSVAVPVLVLGVPLFDYTHVLARRLKEGAELTKADRRHLHHRLLDRGWNQRQVMLFICSLAFLLCITALALFHLGRPVH